MVDSTRDTISGLQDRFAALEIPSFEVPEFVKGLFQASNSGSGSEHDQENTSGESEEHNQEPPGGPSALTTLIASALATRRSEGEGESDQMATPGQNDLMLMTKKLIEIRSMLLGIEHGEGLQLPSIVVVGSQSSGKSSVLEAIVGHEFLPKCVCFLQRNL
jgi:hypothetical protein